VIGISDSEEPEDIFFSPTAVRE